MEEDLKGEILGSPVSFSACTIIALIDHFLSFSTDNKTFLHVFAMFAFDCVCVCLCVLSGCAGVSVQHRGFYAHSEVTVDVCGSSTY